MTPLLVVAFVVLAVILGWEITQSISRNRQARHDIRHALFRDQPPRVRIIEPPTVEPYDQDDRP